MHNFNFGRTSGHNTVDNQSTLDKMDHIQSKFMPSLDQMKSDKYASTNDNFSRKTQNFKMFALRNY